MSKIGIRIYYGDKLIWLGNNCPAQKTKRWKVVHYKEGFDVGQAFIKFAESPLYTTLALWTGSGYKDLKSSFFSLFKIIEAAGGVVKNERGEILTIFRNGKWDLPKGKIEGKKETHRQAAIREVQEETGLKSVNIVAPLVNTYHIYVRKERLILKPTYWFEMFAESTNKLKPQTKENISIVTWVEAEEMAEVQRNTYSSLKELFALPILYPPEI